MMEHGQSIKAMNFILFATMKVTRRGRKLTHNVPQVAEGGYTQTLKRSTDMEDQTNIPNEEQTGEWSNGPPR